jgi:hypothetical protein
MENEAMAEEGGTVDQYKQLLIDTVACEVAATGKTIKEHVESWTLGDLTGRPALVAEFRRETELVLHCLGQGASIGSGVGYGMFQLLALLQAYDEATAQ